MFDSCVVCVNIPPLIKGGIWGLACVCVVSGAAVLLGAWIGSVGPIVYRLSFLLPC